MKKTMLMVRKIGILYCLYLCIFIVQFPIGFFLEKRNKQYIFYRNVMAQLEDIALYTSSDRQMSSEILSEFKTSDYRVANLKFFFRKYNSILYDKAEFIVSTADKYKIDYRLLPAIAMQESNLCKHIYPSSHNCWGWGIYGKKITRFASYEEAIETISKGIKQDYIDKGLTTPEQIMRKYTPPSDGSWAFGVNTFLKSIE